MSQDPETEKRLEIATTTLEEATNALQELIDQMKKALLASKREAREKAEAR